MSERSLSSPLLPSPAVAGEGRDRFEAFFHASPHGILILDDTGTVVEANRRAGEMVGYQHQSIPGVKALQFFDPSTWDQVNQAFIQTQFSGSAQVETELRQAEGPPVPVEILWNRLHSEGRTFFHANIIDITHRRRTQEENRRAIEEAHRANEARLLFLATMSHEIRTPLNGIIGFANLLSESQLSDTQRQYVDMVGRSGDILLRIIDDILNLSRIESGRFELEEISFEPAVVIEEVFEMHANNGKLTEVELLHEVLPGVPPVVRGDLTRIRQILTNLVSNALKFTSRGHILVRCAVQEGGYLAFSVRDTGVGFDPAKIETLFKPFFQEDASTTRKFGGTGLGLAICRKLLDRMGGYIEARSQPDEGAEFWFGIPLKTSDRTATSSPTLGGHRVLLVGPASIGRSLLGKRLRETGLEVSSEEDHESVLPLLKRDAFPLIIACRAETAEATEEFCRRVRRSRANRETPLVLLSPAASTPSEAEAADWGCTTQLRTPFRRAELINTLTPLLTPAPSGPVADPFTEETFSPPSPPPPLATNRPFILIAEDNHINAQLALLVTKKLGFQAHVAHNGREVLAYLTSSQSYSAILMDMRMPDMDGIEATRRIRLGHAGIPVSKIPIFALTANAMDADRKACLQAGMNGFFTKPLRLKEIEEAFRTEELLPVS